ncbi:FkbM family methyltransferase [Rhizobium grahamii]|uniref:FkbM family methyltransferase n=1 Tax=Rhizobium grahamii CCGE 502 TaxID=990285 RepID=S3HN12_9HYPH|nr:FkbM family methyltransferase [Rhizobium grahamii]EPF00313.1 FkbM family methyltransferase [Rhizobium grahamii CCGE 502]
MANPFHHQRASSQEVAQASAAHGALHFSALPDGMTARELLYRINDATCRFSARPLRDPLVLYGAGDMGRLARDYLRAIGRDFAFVVDKNAVALRNDPLWADVQVLHPSEVRDDMMRSALLAVSIATTPFVPLEKALREAGWHDVVPFYDIAESYRDRHPLSNGWFAEKLTSEELARTTNVLLGWEDDLSRAHHLQFLAWRRLREEWTFEGAPVTGDNRFFIPEVRGCLDAVSVFVDGGAHDGSITAKLIAEAGLRQAAIVAIEPDAKNAAAFSRRLASLDAKGAADVTLLPYALDSVEHERGFHDGLGYASQLSDTGRERVRTVTLDSLALSPGFLKLHLEGAELNALRGGCETLQQHRPIVAVTTYHNSDGLWRTPEYLMEQLPAYRFFMRLHSWCGTGAVVYAVPQEKVRIQ